MSKVDSVSSPIEATYTVAVNGKTHDERARAVGSLIETAIDRGNLYRRWQARKYLQRLGITFPSP